MRGVLAVMLLVAGCLMSGCTGLRWVRLQGMARQEIPVIPGGTREKVWADFDCRDPEAGVVIRVYKPAREVASWYAAAYRRRGFVLWGDAWEDGTGRDEFGWREFHVLLGPARIKMTEFVHFTVLADGGNGGATRVEVKLRRPEVADKISEGVGLGLGYAIVWPLLLIPSDTVRYMGGMAVAVVLQPVYWVL